MSAAKRETGEKKESRLILTILVSNICICINHHANDHVCELTHIEASKKESWLGISIEGFSLSAMPCYVK